MTRRFSKLTVGIIALVFVVLVATNVYFAFKVNELSKSVEQYSARVELLTTGVVVDGIALDQKTHGQLKDLYEQYFQQTTMDAVSDRQVPAYEREQIAQANMKVVQQEIIKRNRVLRKLAIDASGVEAWRMSDNVLTTAFLRTVNGETNWWFLRNEIRTSGQARTSYVNAFMRELAKLQQLAQ